jgi:hypothetical protein
VSVDETLEIGVARWDSGLVTTADVRTEGNIQVVRRHQGRPIANMLIQLRSREKRRQLVVEGAAGGFRRLHVKFLVDVDQIWVDGDARPNTATLGGRELDVFAVGTVMRFTPTLGLPFTQEEEARLTSMYRAVPLAAAGGAGGNARSRRLRIGDRVDGGLVPGVASSPEAKIDDARLVTIAPCGAERCGTAHVRGDIAMPIGGGLQATCPLEGDVVFRERDGRTLSMLARCPLHIEGPVAGEPDDTLEGDGELEVDEHEETP